MQCIENENGKNAYFEESLQEMGIIDQERTYFSFGSLGGKTLSP